jgi:hypothetical protein
MQERVLHANRGVSISIPRLSVVLLTLLLVLLSGTPGRTEDKEASNKRPLSFGKDQTIIDLNKVVWEPLTGEGIPPAPRSPSCGGAWPLGAAKRSSASLPTIRFLTIAIPVRSSMSG